MNESAALEVYTPSNVDISIMRPPQKVLEEARTAAQALTDVVSKKAKKVVFNNEQYLEFEDWQTLGRFYGITAKVRGTNHVVYDQVVGFEASADAILVSTNQVISSADAMCLNDEPNWSRKPMFQLRSMAQTRACAKALRNVLAWVVVLAGYRPTPAEEMIEDHEVKRESKPAPPPQEMRSKQNPDSKITDGQRKRLYAIAKSSQCSDEIFAKIIKEQGYGSSKDILVKDYDRIVALFEVQKEAAEDQDLPFEQQ